jgi:hypothetical protein
MTSNDETDNSPSTHNLWSKLEDRFPDLANTFRSSIVEVHMGAATVELARGADSFFVWLDHLALSDRDPGMWRLDWLGKCLRGSQDGLIFCSRSAVRLAVPPRSFPRIPRTSISASWPGEVGRREGCIC